MTTTVADSPDTSALERNSEQAPPSSASVVSKVRWRRLQRLLIIALVLVALLAGGSYAVEWFQWRGSHVSENDARIAGEVVTLASRLDGWLVTRPVIDGDPIKKGQVLARIDDRDARFRLLSVQAGLAAANEQIRQYLAQREMTAKTIDAGVEEANAQITAAEAALANAGHQLDLALTNFNRVDELLKTRSAPKKDWDEAQATLLQRQDTRRQLEAQLTAQRAALATAEAQRGQLQVLDRQIDVLRQQRQMMTAQTNQLRQEIVDRRLIAPTDGVVDKTFADPGDFVQAGQWVMMVHDPGNTWVEANIKETEIGSVAVGQTAEITVDAYPDLVLLGKVIRVGSAATNQFALLPSPNPSGNFTKITQRVPVRIAFDRPDPRLKPGLMVEVSIDVSH